MTTSRRQQIRDNAERLNALLETAPPRVKGVRHEVADRAVAGVVGFQHLGRKWIEVGRDDIDWSGQHHQHVEWRSQLNRFFQLPHLATAYVATGEERYAEAARDYLQDWLAAHPAGPGWQPADYDNTLNLAIRVGVWVRQVARFLDSPTFDDTLIAAILDSIAAQLDHLLENLSPRGNWRIFQAETLLNASIYLEFLSEAPSWRSRAVRVLNECFHRQTLPDGAHIERNPGYHGSMRNVFQKLWRLNQVMPELGLAMDAETIHRMWQYTLAATRPNGALCGIHDGNSRGPREGRRDPDWAKGYFDFTAAAGLPAELPETSQFFPDGGQAFLRDGWGEDATYISFDASELGSAHWHAGRNSLQVHAHGRTLLVDPGSFTYEGSDPYQAYGMSTRAHSTINLNGWDQTWSTQRLQHAGAPGYDVVHSLYDGSYWQGAHRGGWFDPGHQEGRYGAHHRTVLWIQSRLIVVLDHMQTTVTPDHPASLESVWQLCEGGARVDGDRARTLHDDANLLLAFPLQPDGSRIEVAEGETDPLRGWLPGDGEYIPAPQVVLRADALDSWNVDLATVLLPYAGTTRPELEIAACDTTATGAGVLTVRWPNGSRDEICWTRRLAAAVCHQADFDTDGSLVHRQFAADGSVERVFVHDGTYCDPYRPPTGDRPHSFVVAGNVQANRA